MITVILVALALTAVAVLIYATLGLRAEYRRLVRHHNANNDAPRGIHDRAV